MKCHRRLSLIQKNLALLVSGPIPLLRRIVPPPSNYGFRGWRIPALAADLFADISCDTPLNEGHISIFRTNGTSLSPNEPMAIVQVENPSILDGRYIVKNRAADIFWYVGYNSIWKVHLCTSTIVNTKNNIGLQVIEHFPIFHLFKE